MTDCILCDRKPPKSKLITHLVAAHNLSMEDYVILRDYGGIPPKCACGMCDDRPNFTKRGFAKIALGHNTDEFRLQKYIEKNGGPPVCAKCGSAVLFSNGEPRKYCSVQCAGSVSGKNLQTEEMRARGSQSLMEKYGVENASQIPSVRELLSSMAVEKYKQGTSNLLSDGLSEKRSLSMTETWKDPDFQIKMRDIMFEVNKRPELLEEKSKRQLEYIASHPDYMPNLRKLALGKMKNKFSRLHLRVIEYFGLRELGFQGEVPLLDRFLVDELHEEKHIVLEVMGDYVHANPILYTADSLIKLPGQCYAAKQIWKRDAKKVGALKAAGYSVVIVWESDDWRIAKNNLLLQLGHT